MKPSRLTGVRAACCRAALLVLGPIVANATVNLITWGPSTSFVTTASNSPRYASGGAALDLSTAITATSGYTGPSIYGGVQVSGSLTLSALRVLNNHASYGAESGVNNDVFDLRTIDATPANNGRMTALLLWENTYTAINPGDPAPGELELKTFTYTGGYSTNTVLQAYFVARYQTATGFAYMISPTSVTGNRLDSNGGTHTVDAKAAIWWSYDPTTGAGLDNGLDLDQPNPRESLLAPRFAVSAITHVGLLFKLSGKPSDSALSFYRFSVIADERAKAPFKALYNSDTGNVRVYAITDAPVPPPGTPYTFPKSTFDEDKLIRSIDEAADAGIDAFMLSPFATHVPLWQSAIEPPDDHFNWWKYAHPRINTTPPSKLEPIGYYMRPDNPSTPGGDVMQVFVDHCEDRDLPGFASIRLNDYHFIEDMDARPGLWNISSGGAVANDFWRYTHPEYRLARAPLFTRPEYRKTTDVDVTLSDEELAAGLGEARSATVLNWAIEDVRLRMLDYIDEIVQNYPALTGLELDFLRSGIFFDASVSNADREKIMTTFVVAVRDLLDDAGATAGKRYWLSVRVSGLTARLTTAGINVGDFAAAGVDMFVLCASSTTHTVQQGLNLDTIQAAIRGASPQAAVYFEMTEQAVTYAQYDANGNNRESFEWLATRQQLKTAMHLAYKPGTEVDGFSLFNFAYYRDSNATTEVPDSTPPFDVIPSLKDPATVAAGAQHYFFSKVLTTKPTSNVNFKLVLRSPTGGWPSSGNARLRLVSANPLPVGFDYSSLKVTFGIGTATGATLAQDVDVSEPFQVSSAPQFRLPVPAGSSSYAHAWEVPYSILGEGDHTIRISHQSAYPFTEITFNYIELIVP